MSGTDRTVMTAGPLLDIVDDEWRADTLPEDGAISRAGAPPPRRPRAPSLSDAPFSRRPPPLSRAPRPLPRADIQLPPGVNPPTDEAEETTQAEQDAPEKWTELGLHTIAQ